MENVLGTIWTVIKVIGATYGILTVGLWALVGFSNLVEKYYDEPQPSPLGADIQVLYEAFERFKTFFTTK